MSTIIYFSLCILLFSSTISTLPSPTDVYSAVIYNSRNSAIKCKIGWLTPSSTKLQSNLISVAGNQYYTVKEKLFDMDTWTARGIIKRIRCGDLVLRAPFPNVKTVQENWEFRVEPSKIVSVGPSSHVSESTN
ncbi:hypothetical protein I4U23_028548 [Adineta vaga]|nr:hypothetical protein I4U23_028548 [Adineta vaga]